MIENSLWIQLILTLVFSFLTGMELKDYYQTFHSKDENFYFFGSVRTFTLTGLLGFTFYLINPNLFLAGFVALTLIYLTFYYQKLQQKQSSILTYLIWMVSYSYAPLIMTHPLWIAASIFVTIILLLGSKDKINALVKKFSGGEVSTLAKLILLSVVILPLLPHDIVNKWIPVSPFKIWLAVVVVSGVSYLGYISQKYLFPGKGLLVTGIFGGLYSSTATTVVLGKKSNEYPRLSYLMTASILIATGLMYLRLWALTAVFNWKIAMTLVIPISLFAIGIFIVSFIFMQLEKRRGMDKEVSNTESHNPLELKVAFLFAGLFVIMAVITQWVTQYFGADGLKYLSLIVGFTDIDPFVLSLLNGHYQASTQTISSAILIAAGSNNLLKAIYAFSLSEKISGRFTAGWLTLFGLVTIGTGWMML